MKYGIKFLIIGVVLLAFSCLSQESKQHKPNIVVILLDDAGYADFGFIGSTEMETPNLDKLAASGVVFTDAHVSASVCAPSRAGLLAGRYQQRFGFEFNIPPYGLGLDTAEISIAGALHAVGYKTAAIGKWHVGETDEYHPNNRGFDEFYGFLGGSRSYFPDKEGAKVKRSKALQYNGQLTTFEGYLTDDLGDKAVDFIDKFKNDPFFIYFSPNAVHTPMEAKEEHLTKYEGHSRQKLAAMMWSLDENIGKIIDKLENEKLINNTLVFFLSDNGGATPFNLSSCAPLKGYKGSKYEGGHRIPFVMSWQGKISPNQQFDGLTSSFDIFATAANIAGVEQSARPLDGVNLMPFVTGKNKGNPHEELYWRRGGVAGARLAEYKLVRLDDYGMRLYNLELDLGEKNALQDTFPDHANTLSENLQAWENEMNVPLWDGDVNWTKVLFERTRARMENEEPRYHLPSEMKKIEGIEK